MILKNWSALRILASLILGATLACAPRFEIENPKDEADYDPLPVLREDLLALSKPESKGPEEFDKVYDGSFSLVFGGTTGQDTEKFYRNRVQIAYSYLQPEVGTIIREIQQGRNTDWTKPSDPNKKHPTLGMFSEDPSESGIGVAGVNLGTQLWYQSMIDRRPLTLQLAGQNIEVTSPRVGLIAVGPAYRDVIRYFDGETHVRVKVPTEARISVLLHEARHSDCPGGIKDSDLDTIRKANSMEEFFANYERIDCGHFHSACRSGHLKGIEACDSIPWGSYSIGAIYLQAMANNPGDSEKIRVLRARAQDSWDRLQLDRKSMLRFEYGKPNMSSEGLLQE